MKCVSTCVQCACVSTSAFMYETNIVRISGQQRWDYDDSYSRLAGKLRGNRFERENERASKQHPFHSAQLVRFVSVRPRSWAYPMSILLVVCELCTSTLLYIFIIYKFGQHSFHTYKQCFFLASFTSHCINGNLLRSFGSPTWLIISYIGYISHTCTHLSDWLSESKAGRIDRMLEQKLYIRIRNEASICEQRCFLGRWKICNQIPFVWIAMNRFSGEKNFFNYQ